MKLAIHKKVIASVTALSLLVTGVSATASQAQQRSHKAESTIAALFGLAVIGALVAADQKDRKHRRKADVAPHPAHKIKPVTRQTLKARPLPKRARHQALPQQCLRRFDTDQGRARLFAHRCMQRNYAHTQHLPKHCQRQVWTANGPRSGWGARCLRQNGFRVAQR